MSTILKALKRLEAEREVKPPRPLREEVVAALEAAETARVHRSRRWRWLLAAVGGATLAGGAAWLVFAGPGAALRDRLSRPSAAVDASAPSAAAAAPAVQASPAASATAPSTAPLAGPRPSPSSVDADAEPPLGSGAGGGAPLAGAESGAVPLVAVVPRPPPQPELQPDEPAPGAPAGPPPGSIPPAPKQTPRYVRELAAPAPPASPRGDADRAASASEEAPAAAPAPVHKTPASSRPRADTRVQVANPRDLDVLRTVWHPHPERRLALVLLPGESAARELREGETADGWTVLSIEPSSVVLLHDGVELRAAVGGGGR